MQPPIHFESSIYIPFPTILILNSAEIHSSGTVLFTNLVSSKGDRPCCLVSDLHLITLGSALKVSPIDITKTISHSPDGELKRRGHCTLGCVEFFQRGWRRCVIIIEGTISSTSRCLCLYILMCPTPKPS